MSLLELEGVDAFYGRIQALRGVSIRVEKGEVVALIGSNGAGKTTTLRTISGLMHPHSGSIRFDGREITRTGPSSIVELGISQSPEGRRLFPRLQERRSQIAGTLSGGEQQMLAMGRALMARPKLMMLDEPSLGLAPILIETIFSIVREINTQGTTVLLVEQNANKALEVANRAYVLETGVVVQQGSGRELLESAEVQKAYLGM